MHQLKLDHRPRIADEGTLERSIGPNIFESLDDGLVGKTRHAKRRRDRRRLLCASIGGSETSSSAGSLGIHLVAILDHPAEPSLLVGKIR
jgi:hypothetical protein